MAAIMKVVYKHGYQFVSALKSQKHVKLSNRKNKLVTYPDFLVYIYKYARSTFYKNKKSKEIYQVVFFRILVLVVVLKAIWTPKMSNRRA